MKKRLLLTVLATLLTAVGLMAQRNVAERYIANPTLASGTAGWTVTNFNTPQRGNNTQDYATEAYAGWDRLEKTSYGLTQKVKLPKGNYTLVCYAFFRQGQYYNTDASKSLAYLKAGDQQAAISTLGSISAAGYADTQAEGANCFDSRMYRNALDFTVSTDNTEIELGIVGSFDVMRSWCIVGRFELLNNDLKPTIDEPYDLTYKIVNSGFEYRNMTGWTLSPSDGFGAQGNEDYPKVGRYYAEKWQESGALSNRSMSQTITGLRTDARYKLAAYGYHSNSDTKEVVKGAYLKAGGVQTEIIENNTIVLNTLSSGNLTIEAGLTGGTQNWVCFDHFTLQQYFPYFSENALPLPNNLSSNLSNGTWYYYDVTADGDYTLEGGLANIVYTADGKQVAEDIVPEAVSETMALTIGRIYFKPTANNQKLRITRKPTWVGSEVAAGEYYLYNMAGDMFMTSGTTWATRGSLDPNGAAMAFTLTAKDGGYTITNTMFNDGTKTRFLFVGGEPYEPYVDGDGTAPVWNFEGNTTEGYILKQGSRYLIWDGTSYGLATTATRPTDNGGRWQLVTRAQLLANLDKATPQNKINATFLIKNSWFSKNFDHKALGWVSTKSDQPWVAYSDKWNANAYAQYDSWGEFDCYQEIANLPKGEYALSAQGTYEHNNGSWPGKPYFYINDVAVAFPTPVNDAVPGRDNNDKYQANGETLEFNAPQYKVENITTQLLGGTLRVGVKSQGGNVSFSVFDNFSLVCRGIYFCQDAIPLPNDETTALDPTKWYYYDVTKTGHYTMKGNVKDIVYTENGAQFRGQVTSQPISSVMTLHEGRVYFRSTTAAATLMITQEATWTAKDFTVCAYNVDGLPQTFAGITINSNAPREDGTRRMSAKLAANAYDIIAVQEDFNYHGNLLYYLGDYNKGQWYGSFLGENSASLSGIRFDTDGLCIFTRNDHSMKPYVPSTASNLKASEEDYSSRTKWTTSVSGEGNQFVTKGYRKYEVTIDSKLIDVYILHMDAGTEDGKAYSDDKFVKSRNAQWKQLAEAINSGGNHTRPKIVMGDTNSRWTREDIKTNFVDILSGRYDVNDAWVELCRGGNYAGLVDESGYGWGIVDQSDPTNFSKYEVVDKVFYLNPLAEDGFSLAATSFDIPQDFTYDDGTQLNEHKPVVVSFTITEPAYESSPEANRWEWKGENLVYTFTDTKKYPVTCPDGFQGWYLYNLYYGKGGGAEGAGHRAFLAYNKNSKDDTQCSVVANPNDAIRWNITRSDENEGTLADVVDDKDTRNSSYRIYFDYLDTGHAGFKKNDGADKLTFLKGNSYTDAYCFKLHNRDRYFNLDKVEGGMGYITRAHSRGPKNEFYLISQNQVEEYNKYVRAYEKALNYLNVLPLTASQRSEYASLMNQSTCWNDGTDESGNKASKVRVALEKLHKQLEEWFDDDQTSNIANPSFEDGAHHDTRNVQGWTCPDGAWQAFSSATTEALGGDPYREFDGREGNYVYNVWGGTPTDGKFFVKQTIPNLPEGYYILQANFTTHPSGNSENLVGGQAYYQDSVRYERPDITLLCGTSRKKMTYIHYRNNRSSNDDLGNRNEIPHGSRGDNFMVDNAFYHSGGPITIGAESRSWFEADNFTLRRYDFCFDVAVEERGAGFASTAIRYNTELPSVLTVFRADHIDENNTSVHMESVEAIKYIKAGEGIVVRGPIGKYRFYRTREKASAIANNYLRGTVVDITRGEMNGTNYPDYTKYDYYMLGNLKWSDGITRVGFYKLNLSKSGFDALAIRKNKAYLIFGTDDDGNQTILNTANAKAFYEMNFGDTDKETGIESLEDETAADVEEATEVTAIYDLRGMRQSQLQRGINIVRLSDGTVRKIMVR